MKLRSIFILGIGIAAGIYISIQEEENAKTKKTKSRDFKKVIDNLLVKLEELFNETKDLKSDEIKINMKERISHMKKTLNNLSGKDITETTKNTLQKIARAIRKMANELETRTNKSTKSKIVTKKALPKKKVQK